MYNISDFLIENGILFLIIFLIGIIAIVIYGYLWNYYVIQELRRMNTRIIELREVIELKGNQSQNIPQMYAGTPANNIQDEDKRLNESLKKEYESLRIKEENRRLQEEIAKLKNNQ